LADHGRPAEAEVEYRALLQRNPEYYPARANLGRHLAQRGELREAEDQLRAAIHTKPDEASLHSNLGHILNEQKRWKEAERELRKAIQLKSDDGEAHNKLGYALAAQGRRPEALKEYRQAIRLRPKDPLPHCNLGDTLRELGKFSEAEKELRKTLQLKPDLADAHYNLGLVYQEQNRLSAAESEYREVIKLNPADPEGRCNLGLVLQNQGRFAEALEHLRLGHKLGSKRPGWPYPSAQWVQNCERLVELNDKLPEILSGQRKPANIAERVTLASVCQLKKRYGAAARFYDEAFAEKPQLADDLSTGHRYDAACAAAQAGCGQGEDGKQTDVTERARLRKQALDWLRADLAAWNRVLTKNPDKAGPTVARKMTDWLNDPDFARVRGPEVLAKLPEGERADWQKLWVDVEEMRAKIRQENRPKNKPAK
jgi:Flp pilus assembly protein TadD